VRRDAQHGLTVVVGVTALRLSLTDVYLRYVKASLRPWLVVAGVLLVAIGVVGLFRDSRAPQPVEHLEGTAPHEHDTDAHVPRVAWLLLLPVLAIFLVSPASLGAFAAGRSDVRLAAPKAQFPALAAEVDGAVPMSLREYSLRSYYDDEEALKGRQVRLVGFVTPDAKGPLLTRFQLSCCAADGVALKVRLEGLDPAPTADTWLEVVAEYVGPERDPEGEPLVVRPPVAKVVSTKVIPTPTQPYET
jgi:uncharacterized repeat protein (TIGR03943 family)